MSGRHRVAIVNCLDLPEPDPDQDLMIGALSAAGIDASLAAWDDERANWASFDICVLRATWDYHERPDDFLNWCAHVARVSRLENPLDVVRWNIHKGYLQDLERAGLDIVPTAFLEKGSDPDLKSIMDRRGWADVVVKPCISAASANTRRFTIDEAPAGTDFLRSLASERDMMVQLFMPSVDTPGSGERAAMLIGGELTHAIEKKPRFADDDESVSDELPVTDEERDLFERALAVVPGDVLYARLDTMADAEGTRLISELEVIEPSLFLKQSERAQGAFVRAIEHALST